MAIKDPREDSVAVALRPGVRFNEARFEPQDIDFLAMTLGRLDWL